MYRRLLILGCLAAPLSAQTVEEQVAAGIASQLARDPHTALTHFEVALRLDPRSYEASWRGAEALMDIGKQTPDSVKSPERDSLYQQAESLARVAVAANPEGADGYYALSAAIGRASLTKSKKERVRRAAEIREAALRSLELQPEHHKTLHVLGRWNAEIMRLSGLTRFFAKTFLGGKIFNAAAWDSAVVYLDRAVVASPENIYHRLDLAEVFVDRQRYTEARSQLERIGELPVYDVMDPVYREQAAALLRQIQGKKDDPKD